MSDPQQLNDEQKKDLGIERDFTQERKDRVVPVVNEVFRQMAAFDFKHNYKTEDYDNKSKQDKEHEQYRTFVAENMRTIITNNDLRYGDVQYLCQLMTTTSNLLEEVTTDVKFDERVVACAIEIMGLIAEESNLTPSERDFDKTEEMDKVEKKLHALGVEAGNTTDPVILKEIEERAQKMQAYLEDIVYKHSKGFVVFRDIMRRIIVPTFEKHNITFLEAASVFSVIGNTVDNVTKTLLSIIEQVKIDGERKLWGVSDVKSELPVKKMLEILENKE